jgi:hypothetical protein
LSEQFDIDFAEERGERKVYIRWVATRNLHFCALIIAACKS